MSKPYSIIEVAPGNIDTLWPQIAPVMQLPVDRSHGEVTMDSTKDRIKQGIARLFIVIENNKIIAVNTLEVRFFDSGIKSLYIPMVGGTKMEMWGEEFYNIAKKIGKEIGARELRGIAVRDGWLRLAKKRGWEEVHTIISYQLEE